MQPLGTMAAPASGLSTLVGRFGLIRGLTASTSDASAPRLHAFTCEPAKTSVFIEHDVVGGSAGVGTTAEAAFQTAVGEAVEHFCSACYRDEDLVYASKNELGEAAIGLDAFALFKDRQYDKPGFPFTRWLPERPIHWAKGWSLLTGRIHYIPASLVYLPYKSEDENDNLFWAVSTGQACHPHPALALLSGLCEVIERDAFMITWLRALPLPRVDYGRDTELAGLVEHLAGDHMRFHLFDMTFDFGVPSFLCLAEGRSRRGSMLAAGAATRMTARDAAVKALLESAHTFRWAKDLLATRPAWRPAPDWSNVRSFADHVRLYCEPEMMAHADFLLRTPEVRRFESAPAASAAPEQLLEDCLRRVQALGLEAVAVNLTTPEVAEAGLFVSKVFIPGTVCLTACYGVPTLGSPRLFRVPTKMGYYDAVGNRLNLSPHPFP